MPAATATLSDSTRRRDRKRDESVGARPRLRTTGHLLHSRPRARARAGAASSVRPELAGRVGRPERRTERSRRNVSSSSQVPAEAGMMEVCPHPATDDFGVPEVNGSRQGKRCRRRRGPRRFGGSCRRFRDPERHPGRAGAATSARREVGQRPVRHLGDRQNALRRLGFGGAGELAVGRPRSAAISAAPELGRGGRRRAGCLCQLRARRARREWRATSAAAPRPSGRLRRRTAPAVRGPFGGGGRGRGSAGFIAGICLAFRAK